MEPLYAAGCRDYPDYNECALFIKLATFTPAQGILTFTVICGFLNHYVFCSSRLRTIYGPKYLALARDEQRRVGVLHVGIVMKVTAFCLLATPLYFIQLRNHTWLDPGPIPCLTLAEMAAGAIASFAALSLFDLIYSDNIKLVYVLHHLGTLAWIYGVCAIIMSVPAHSRASSIAQLIFLCKTCLSWILFSSLGSTISRLTYLTYQFFPQGPLYGIFLAGLIGYTFLMILEAGMVVYLITTISTGLPPVALQGLFVLQALFTATKVKTAQRIWAVCQRQAQASLLKHRKCSPTMREKVEAGCSLCK